MAYYGLRVVDNRGQEVVLPGSDVIFLLDAIPITIDNLSGSKNYPTISNIETYWNVGNNVDDFFRTSAYRTVKSFTKNQSGNSVSWSVEYRNDSGWPYGYLTPGLTLMVFTRI